MTTSGLQFDRELKTAASQICSSVKSGKRNWLSTLLVIFHYLLYLLTVKGFSFFRSIHQITPMLIPLFIRGWGDWQCLHINISFIFFLTTCTQMQSFSPAFILISCISDRYITSLSGPFISCPGAAEQIRLQGDNSAVSWNIFSTSSVSSDTLGILVQMSSLGLEEYRLWEYW